VLGELERDLEELELPKLHLFRPSLLLGERREHRAGESVDAAVMKGMNFLFRGPFRKYRAIQADIVEADGILIYEGDRITMLCILNT
jgi:hypothetical protein